MTDQKTQTTKKFKAGDLVTVRLKREGAILLNGKDWKVFQSKQYTLVRHTRKK